MEQTSIAVSKKSKKELGYSSKFRLRAGIKGLLDN